MKQQLGEDMKLQSNFQTFLRNERYHFQKGTKLTYFKLIITVDNKVYIVTRFIRIIKSSEGLLEYLKCFPQQNLTLIQEMQLAPRVQVRSCLAPVTFTHLLTTSVLHSLSFWSFRKDYKRSLLYEIL